MSKAVRAITIGLTVRIIQAIGETHHARIPAVLQTKDMAEFVKRLLGDPLEEEIGSLRHSIEHWTEPWQSNESISSKLSNTEDEVQLRNEQVEIDQSKSMFARRYMLAQLTEKVICNVLPTVG